MKFVDLNAQFRVIESEIRAAIDGVLAHGQFIMGAEVFALEDALADYCGVAHAVTAASGTDALLMALMARGIGAGDAVIVPPFTFVASAEVVQLLGATTVFVDVDEATYNLCPTRLAETVTRIRRRGKLNLRGVIPVDLFGLPADYSAIQTVADEHDLFVLSDAAQSFGGTRDGIRAGAFGEVAATSFFPAKPLGCYGDGGALFTDDDDLAARARSIREHGMGADRYENVRTGITGRMDTIQAAVLACKLKIFDDELAARRRIAARYSDELAGVVMTPTVPENCQSAWAQYTVRAGGGAGERDRIRAELQAQNIPTAVYYPRPLHRQPAFAEADGAGVKMPVADKLAAQVFSLPIHPYLSEAEQGDIINAVTMTIKATKTSG